MPVYEWPLWVESGHPQASAIGQKRTLCSVRDAVLMGESHLAINDRDSNIVIGVLDTTARGAITDL